jgi:amino acid transporter/mannitol/fructose-specific phosphotransferase system IIA component (Ntr-type)
LQRASSDSQRIRHRALKKNLTLFDVYSISTGAMFSSGFFLLPGLAAAITGTSVVLAYFVAGILVLPAMFSKAELATAMPLAGGTYYYLDRSMGPLVGTIGGLGTWFAMVLKIAFALIGIGAYLGLYVQLPIEGVAVGLTLFFMILNVMGAKETTGIQNALVTALIVILLLFVVGGLANLPSGGPVAPELQGQPLFAKGFDGFLATIGLVFVSYAGLTKVSSVAEEVKNPDRDIPLGMILSLLTATSIYVVGVWIILQVHPAGLFDDLTPVATAAETTLGFLPAHAGTILVVIAAIAAFASTGNAGLMSASRYLLAMARDRLIWARFQELGRFGTPTAAVVVSSLAIIVAILTLDVTSVAKLASAFQLLIFAFVNMAVIIMRESGIDSYVPGFRSPLYPWVQIVGMLTPFFLIAEMGWLSVVFTLGVCAFCVLWYYYYARTRVVRDGAIYHLFARLGHRRFDGLDIELRGILQSKGLKQDDPYEDVVARAFTIDAEPGQTFEELTQEAAELLAGRIPIPVERLADGLVDGRPTGLMPSSQGVALPHVRLKEADQAEIVLVRSREGVTVNGGLEDETSYRAIIYMASPEGKPGQHLRILAQIALHAEDEHFIEQWLAAEHRYQLREILLRDERYISIPLEPHEPAASWVGQELKNLELPPSCLIAVIRRGSEVIMPKGNTVLEMGDRLTVLGEPEDIETLHVELHPDAKPFVLPDDVE